jgi:hypothetical protein
LLPIARPHWVVLVAVASQTSTDAALEIVDADEVLAIMLVVRRNSQKAPVGGEAWICVTDVRELAGFLTALVVPHEC